MNLTYDPSTEEGMEQLEHLAEDLLRRMHMSGTLDGFRYLIHAIAKTTWNPAAIRWITKELYWDIADRYDVTPSRVERSIRNAIDLSWKLGGRDTMEEIAGHPLTRRPTSSQLIDMAAAYIRKMR